VRTPIAEPPPAGTESPLRDAKAAPSPDPADKRPEIALGPVNGERVYRRLLKSVVWVIAPQRGDMLFFGTGSLVEKPNRLVLTNYHVVGNADKVAICFPLYRDGKLISERDYFLDQFKKEDVIFGRVSLATWR
jgi:S1-C subfamily serine protease